MNKMMLKKVMSGIIASLMLMSSSLLSALEVFAEETSINDIPIVESTDLKNVVLSKEDVIEYLDYEQLVDNKHIERIYSKENSLDTVVFLNEDGSETAYIFDENVKYINEVGEVADKSNMLYDVKETKGKLCNYSFATYDNDIRSYFPKSLSVDDGILVESDNQTIELTPLIKKSIEVKEIDGSVLYYNAFGENTALKYTPLFNGYKEDIILEEYVDKELKFVLNPNGLSPVISDGTVKLLDSSEEVVAVINPIYAYDSNVEECKITLNNHFKIEPMPDDKFVLTIVVDNEFLKSPDTVYPVIIDPTVTFNATGTGTSKSILDTPIYNGNAVSYQTAGVNPTAILGYVDSSYGSGRLLMRFPGLATQFFWNSEYTITSASLTLKDVSGLENSSYIYAYNYTGENWNENSTYSSSKWNGIGTALSCINFSYPDKTLRSFMITSAVQSWKNDNNALNKGLILINDESETDISKRKIISTTEGTTKPYLSITYSNTPSRTIDDGIYYIRNKHSNKYLNIDNNGTTNRTPVTQFGYHGDKNQRFNVTYGSDGYYSIRPMNISDQTMAIDLQSSSLANADGTDAQIWTYSSNYNEQKFLITSAVGGGYQIGTKSSNGEKVLEVENSSNADNAIVQIRQYSDTRTNDNWIFEEVNFGSAPNYDDIAVGEIRPPNCGGFALRLTDLVSDLQLELPQWSSVEACAIKTKEIFDGLDLGREIRIIYDYDTPTFPIADNEYRVAIRVRTTSSGYPNWDYHYQIQLDDGSWAHKQGGLASEKLGFVNPSRTEAWAHGYNSNVLYFAVTY